MNYVLTKNNVLTIYPYSLEQLRSSIKDASLPSTLTDELLSNYGVYKVFPTEPPPHNIFTQRLREGTPVLVDGVWKQSWNIEDLEREVVEELIRNKRNKLLTNSDWTQIQDATVDKQAWATYRQQLRDITSQEEFPFNVTWPTAP